jgi:AcrR family transcriptional regulator
MVLKNKGLAAERLKHSAASKRAAERPVGRKRRAAKPRKPDARTELTRASILDVAERLFVGAGFHGVSLRQINAEAGVNVAAINYHFGNKRKLFEAVIARRLDPIARDCSERLKACHSTNQKAEDLLDKTLRAFVGAFIDATVGPEGQVIAELIARATTESDPVIAKMANHHFDIIWEQLDPLIMQSLPGYPPAKVYWRLFHVVGGVMRLCVRPQWIQYRSQGACDPENVGQTVEEFLEFAKAGLIGHAGSTASD